MNFFDRDHGVQVGDQVVSSAYSSLYPSGMPIGTISEVANEPGTTTRTAIVRPNVPFNDLEQLVVIP